MVYPSHQRVRHGSLPRQRLIGLVFIHDRQGETMQIEMDKHKPAVDGLLRDVHTLDDLDRHVKVWSDYSKSHFHPKSLHEVNQHQHGNMLTPFDTFTSGQEVCRSRPFQDWAYDDDFRFFAEACDSVQVGCSS